MGYLRAYTGVPVPVVYYVDENPFARVGGELVVMSEVSVFVGCIFFDFSIFSPPIFSSKS